MRHAFHKAPIFRLAVALLLLVGVGLTPADAAPSRVVPSSQARHVIPDWLSEATASRLNVGFDVLVPLQVPAPFAGEPAVTAYAGYYSLYWLIPGTPPTYLQISGEVGGVIPDFSYYDRNVPLQVNATVQGYPAYRDLTPIYDKVYWRAGNVVYIVDSRNLTATDSLTLANSLVPLTVPATEPGDGGAGQPGSGPPRRQPTLSAPASVSSGAAVTILVDGVNDATLSADGGTFLATGATSIPGVRNGAVEWRAPQTAVDQTVTFTLSETPSGTVLASAQTTVIGTGVPQEPTPPTLRCPDTVSVAKTARIRVRGAGVFTVSATDGAFPAEPPNTDFAPSADGGSALSIDLGTGGAAGLDWLAPGAPLTAYIFLIDATGNRVGECGINVVDDVAQGVAQAEEDAPSTSGDPGLLIGDGTGIVGDFEAVVAAVVSWRAQPQGDATGGPPYDPYLPEVQTDLRPLAYALPSPTPPPPTPTPEPTPTLVPASGPDGMVAQLIGPEGGELVCPAGATLMIPPGALAEPATVTIRPVADSRLPDPSSITLISGTAFDVTIAQADGTSVRELAKPARLTILLPEGEWREGVTLYRVTGTRLDPLDHVTSTERDVSTSLTRFSRFVVGIPGPSTRAAGSDPFPLLLGAFGALLLTVAAVAVGSAILRRGPRPLPTRGPIANRARLR